MAGFEEFERVSESLREESRWPTALAELSVFSLISIHFGHGSPRFLITFEMISGGVEDRIGQQRENAVRFGLAFDGVVNLVMRGFADVHTFLAAPSSSGGYTMRLRGPESDVSFDFASVELADVHWFTAGSI